jgi:hypothetical protein
MTTEVVGTENLEKPPWTHITWVALRLFLLRPREYWFCPTPAAV